MKIDEKTRFEIVELHIQEGMTYDELAEKYNISKGRVGQIVRANKFKQKLPSKTTRGKQKAKVTRTKKQKEMREKAIVYHVHNKSELFVNGILDQYKAIQYAVNETAEVIEKMKTMRDNLEPELKNLIKAVEKNPPTDPDSTIELISSIRDTLYKVNNIYAQNSLILNGVNQIKNLTETTTKITEKINLIKQYETLLSAYFNALNVLHENDFQRVKARAIEIEPYTRKYIEDWELTETQTESE